MLKQGHNTITLPGRLTERIPTIDLQPLQTDFSTMPDRGLVILLKDTTSLDLQALLDFMYFGEVSVPHERINSFLETAQSLRVKVRF